jgi:hypothetical protein
MAYEIFFVRSSGDAPATPSGYGDSFATHADTVTFNAGNLSTISDCVSEVESKLKRGTLSTTTTPTLAQVQGWLSRKKQELAEVKNFQWKRKYAYADTTAGHIDTFCQRIWLVGGFRFGTPQTMNQSHCGKPIDSNEDTPTQALKEIPLRLSGALKTMSCG